MTSQRDEKTGVAVIGGGSWGTALANLLALKGCQVSLWVFEPELLQILRQTRENSFYLPGIVLPETITFSDNVRDVVQGKSFVLVVVPSHVLRQTIALCRDHLEPGTILVSATKGIEISSLKRMSEILVEELGESLSDNLAVVSGPSFAREVAENSPTTVVVASKIKAVAEKVQILLNTPYFRTYTNWDVIGVEMAGALKNVIAIAAGASDGLGFGGNTKAALLTRGLAEMTRLGAAMGAEPLTFAGLSGMGDLILTCNSTLSRNYMTGFRLGKGMPLKEITASLKMVAEGINTTRSAYLLSRRIDVEMPIVDQVHAILFENKPPQEAVKSLMTRKLKQEHRHLMELYTQRQQNDPQAGED